MQNGVPGMPSAPFSNGAPPPGPPGMAPPFPQPPVGGIIRPSFGPPGGVPFPLPNGIPAPPLPGSRMAPGQQGASGVVPLLGLQGAGARPAAPGPASGGVQPPTAQLQRLGLGGLAGQQGTATPPPPPPPLPGRVGSAGGMPGSLGMAPVPLPPPGVPRVQSGRTGPPSGSGMAVGMPQAIPPPSVNTGRLAGIPPPPLPGTAIQRGPGMPPPPAMMPPPPNGALPPPSSRVASFAGNMPLPPPPGPPRFGPPPPLQPPASVGGQQRLAPPPLQPMMPHGGGNGMLPPPPPPIPAPGMARDGGSTDQEQDRSGIKSSRIDPSQMPRPSAAPSEPAEYVTHDDRAPPPASSRFVVRDTGSAGPRYMRSTLYQVPVSADLLNSTGMGFAVVVAPMALPGPGDDPIQVAEMGDVGPVRCTRCRAYMNPHVRWTSGGKSFVCNFCGASNTTPDAYYCPLGADGRRRDVDMRPELFRGSVEYVAPADYCIRPPMAPAHFFVLDASYTAVSSGALATACSAILGVLDDMPFPDRCLVGLATFDSQLQFYALRAGASGYQMLVVGDTSDVFAPDSAPLLSPLGAVKTQLQALLKQLPELWKEQRATANAGGAAIEAAIAALKSKGGKVHAFLAALPSTGAHALKLRDGGLVGDKEKLVVLTSADNTLKSLAMVAADFQVSVDIALLAQGYMDVASLLDLVSTTGGTLYQYTPFHPAMDHDQVLNDLKWNLVRPQALEAVMRVRCSTGVDVSSYVGHCYRSPTNPTDVYLPAIDSDKAVVAHLALTEKLSTRSLEGHPQCYLQAAMLYTSLDGRRLIRVHTLALSITDSVSTAFKGADVDAATCVLARRVAGMLPGGALAPTREVVTAAVVNTLAGYRKHCAPKTNQQQLILPEGLKLFPLHCLALLKGAGLKDGAKPDERSIWCGEMLSLPPARITPLLYPRLIAFHALLADGGLSAVGGVPMALEATAAKLSKGGVYLLENGRDAVLYLDRDVDPRLLQDLLGVDNHEALHALPVHTPLLPLDNKASMELQELLTQVRIQRSSFMRLRVARHGDTSEVAFFAGLVEDRSSAGVSYVDYLVQVHRMVLEKMTKER